MPDEIVVGGIWAIWCNEKYVCVVQFYQNFERPKFKVLNIFAVVAPRLTVLGFVQYQANSSNTYRSNVSFKQNLIIFLFFNIFRLKREPMFQIEEKREKDISILQVSGIMLNEESQILSHKVKELISTGVKKIVIDLGKINLLNSCFGLGVLAACWGSMNRENGKLLLANPSKKVKRILEITKLNQVFDVFSTVEDAISYFK